MGLLRGFPGRVTFLVLVVTAVVYSALATIGFTLVASSGRDAIRERIEVVLDEFEASIRRGGPTVRVTTADGVSATMVAASADPTKARGTIQVERVVEVEGDAVKLVGHASEASLSDSLRSLYRTLWVGVPFATVMSALVAGAAAKRTLRPVATITELAESIGPEPGDLRVPVPPTGDEIEHLAETVNGMLDRIEEGRAAQRRFTSDAAHELRTPLMALQGEIELVRTGVQRPDASTWARLDDLCQRLGDRIDDLLLLATIDEGRPIEYELVDLAAVTEAECSAVDPGICLAVVPAVVRGDRALLSRAVRNLVANARRHASSRVVVTVDVVDSRAWLHVDDDGGGIDPARRASLFRRFARLDDSRAEAAGGSGLGLAIVASVATAHHGGTAISDSPIGGARVSLWLPLGSQHPSYEDNVAARLLARDTRIIPRP